MSTFVGVILAIISNSIQAIGFILQKKGHKKVKEANKGKKPEERTSVGKSLWWLSGLSLYAIGGVIGVVALNFAPQSVVTPIGAWNLVASAILSTLVLGEKMLCEDIIGIILIVVGNVIIVVFGPSSSSTALTVAQLTVLYTYIDFIILSITLVIFLIIIFIIVKYYERKNFKADDTNVEIKHGRMFLMIGYTSIAGFFSGYLVLFQKSFIYIVTSSFAGSFADNMKQVLTYFILVGFPLFLILMEYYRQKALSYFGALYVVPIFGVISLILTTFSGGIYFREFSLVSGYKLGLFLGGIAVVLIGVFILAWDVGKLLKELEEYIKVSILDAKSNEHDTNDIEPVYCGVVARKVQVYFYNHDSLVKNPKVFMQTKDDVEMQDNGNENNQTETIEQNS